MEYGDVHKHLMRIYEIGGQSQFFSENLQQELCKECVALRQALLTSPIAAFHRIDSSDLR